MKLKRYFNSGNIAIGTRDPNVVMFARHSKGENSIMHVKDPKEVTAAEAQAKLEKLDLGTENVENETEEQGL